ncbi:hypothetical protein DFH29DRAFT_1016124 [Suillus ampliporus]|nr:hypothetical protein DFH29DRAFT_1016124 [Suillus ampliporus]
MLAEIEMVYRFITEAVVYRSLPDCSYSFANDLDCHPEVKDLFHNTTEEVEAAIKKGLPAECPQLKIEAPANRYDLVCMEGILCALCTFLGKEDLPEYILAYPPGGEKDLITVTVSPETQHVRPFFACAVLRNVKFTPQSYASFIDLQAQPHSHYQLASSQM